MFSLSIAVGNVSWAMLFKTEESSQNAWARITSTGPSVTIEDDFGQTFAGQRDKILGAMLENLDISRLGQIERALHQARTQVKYDGIARQDPGLQASNLSRGPAILSPMGNGAHR